MVTTVSSTATGVAVGPLKIGRVISQAVTQARGRTGTAITTYLRQWCGLSIEDTSVPECFDPTDPAYAALIDTANQQLGKLRISAPPVAQQASPGGYQAVIIKDPGTQAADNAVNNDATPTVPGLQAIYYNDGAEGRSRVIVQLAGVEAESRYGIITLPDFGSGGEEVAPAEDVVDNTVQDVTDAVTPTVSAEPPAPAAVDETPPPPPPAEQAREIAEPDGFDQSDYTPVMLASHVVPASHPVLPAPGRPFAERILRVPAQIVRDAIHLLVSNPRDFGLLFALWALLATPIYLGLRRRARADALMT